MAFNRKKPMFDISKLGASAQKQLADLGIASIPAQRRKKHKYGVTSSNAERTYNGRVYASKLELEIAKTLHSLLSPDYKLDEQVKYIVQTLKDMDTGKISNIIYIADFVITDKSDASIYHVLDAKGKITAVFSKKRNSFKRKYKQDIVCLPTVKSAITYLIDNSLHKSNHVPK